MNTDTWRLTFSCLALGLLAACDAALPEPPAGSALTPETIATRETPPEQEFKGILQGRPVHLIVHDCKVYKVDPGEGENVTWTLVLRPEPYPLPRSCIRQTLTAGKDSVTAFIGLQAFGAGGCCSGTPEHRSKDGVNWKPN